MKESKVSRSTISRIPTYLRYLKTREPQTKNISATTIARELGLGDVQVRKDLSSVSGFGRPKTGYDTDGLIATLEAFLGHSDKSGVVLVGAGKLGRALLDYTGFHDYGLDILAAFDIAVTEEQTSKGGKPIYPMAMLDDYIREHHAKIGIIAVPAAHAQDVCDQLVRDDIIGILSFAPCTLRVPPTVCLQAENMALSLAYLNSQVAAMNE